MAKILVIDDDFTLCSMLATRLESKGFTAQTALSLTQGFDLACSGNFDIILLDVQLPDGDGLEYLTHFTSVESQPEVIIMTGSGDPDGAKKAIASGAWDYLEKPHVIRDLLLPVTRAMQFREEKLRKVTIPVALKRENIIGQSKEISKCFDKVASAASSDASVLLTGETGTGKELFARAIHENSSRSGANFVVVDCAALPETLIESTLFGHVKGAFTGAGKDSLGLISLADNGTLFLDEIGELPLEIQKKLLRVLQEQRYRAVGSVEELRSNFRVIAATNRDVAKLSEEGRFRNDLLFRLRSFSIHLPPLRDRIEDLSLIVQHELTEYTALSKSEQKTVSAEFMQFLQTYHWPGNVRELKQVLNEVLASAADYEILYAYHLPEHIRVAGSQANLKSARSANTRPKESLSSAQPLPWREYKARLEVEYVEHLMAYTGGDMKTACAVSGLSRARLYQLLKKKE